MSLEPRLLIGLLFVLISYQIEQESVVATADNLSVSASEVDGGYRARLLSTGVRNAPNVGLHFSKDLTASCLAVFGSSGWS